MRITRTSAIVSAVVMLPFIVLQLLYGQGAFPTVLFVFMWLLTLTFFAIVIPLVNHLRAGRPILDYRGVVPRVVFVILIAWFWVGLVVDQMPCFLGVPNCD